jgi:hypothetical protein
LECNADYNGLSRVLLLVLTSQDSQRSTETLGGITVKLFLACVAALSLAGCAEEPTSTSGDNEVNVAGTKEAQSFREDTLWKRLAGDLHVRFEDVKFSEKVGTFSEALMPESISGKTCMDCEILAVHQSNGRIDDIELWTYDGNLICKVRQSSTGLVSHTCPDQFISR